MVGLGLAVAILIAALDQLVKLGIVALFADRPPGYAIDLTPFFDLQMNRNTGITWGMFNNGSTANALLFSALAAVVVVVLAELAPAGRHAVPRGCDRLHHRRCRGQRDRPADGRRRRRLS